MDNFLKFGISSHKGVSVIIATLILLMITSVGGAVVWALVSDIINTSQIFLSPNFELKKMWSYHDRNSVFISSNTGGGESTELLLTLFNPPFESAKQHVKENDIVGSFSFLKIADWPGIKAIGQFTVASVTKHIETDDKGKVRYIVYDPEPFVTPIEELENVGQNINNLADKAHDAGFLYGIAPATETIINPRSSDAFKETDWKKIDLFIMQMQVYGRNNGPQAVIDFVNDVGGNAKQINPDLKLILQVNAGMQPVDDISKEISSLKNLIDGIAVLCYPENQKAPCTEAQFNSVIDLR